MSNLQHLKARADDSLTQQEIDHVVKLAGAWVPWAVTGLGGALLGGFAGTALANKGRQEEVNTSGLIGALGGTAAGLLARPHLDAALAPAGHSAGFTPVEMDAVWGR